MRRAALLQLFLVVVAAGFLLTLAGRGQAPPREDAYRQNNIGVAHLERYDFKSAAASFQRALQIDSGLAMARLNLAIALLHAGQPEAAAPHARAAADAMPEAPNAHYIVGLVARADNRTEEAMAAFRRVLAIDPIDAASRVQLAQLLLAEQKFPESRRLFEEAVQLEPFNATATYGWGTALVRSGEREQGAEVLRRFEQLRDNPAAITYSSTYLEQGRHGEAIASTGAEPELADPAVPQVVFRDVTEELLGSVADVRGLSLADIDRDGDLDLAIVGPGRLRLLANDKGRFTPRADLKMADEGLVAVVAGDYDNDARPDLFVLTAGGGRLVGQQSNGTWRDVTAAVRLPSIRPAATAAWADVDHDGDLDIVTGAPQLVRNNGNGSFADVTGEARLASAPAAIAIVPTDYDNRRDIDLLFLPSQGPPALFGNARDGTFRNVAEEARLAPGAGANGHRAAAAGDVNKDSFTDFFLTRAGAAGRFALSDGGRRFVTREGPAGTSGATAAQFIDYDNDGMLDLLTLTPGGPRLWRQLKAQWIEVTEQTLPPALRTDGDPALELSSGDIDGDGDTDVVVRLTSGRVRIWRNDGGNRRSSLTVRLDARVSNRSAIGARVDVGAGSLRQRVDTFATTPAVSPADLVVGLGARTAADVVRVLWPAGILQAETSVAASRRGTTNPIATIQELNRKPSSCPFLYTWNGTRFEFVTDFMGGGEMGAWVGPGAWNSPDPDEYVRIRGDQLRPRNGRYEIRVTNELEEAAFIDRLHLVAVSHPQGTDIFPNEGLRSPAERAPLTITTVQHPRPPRRALDHHGHDVLDRVKAIDRRFVDDFARHAIQGYAERHWIELDLGVSPDDPRVTLLLTGWTDYAFSSDNVAAHQAGVPFHLPSLEIKNAAGEWVTAIAEIGLPVGRPQTIPVDLSALVARGVRDVRLVTTLRVYWDQILVDTSPGTPFLRHDIEAVAATLRWRGFSAESGPDGREPATYDYQRVSAFAPWKVMPGRYTREGGVLPLLSAIDDRFVITAPGDEMALSFDATAISPPPPGWTMTFLLFVDGFSKEMNLHSGSPDRLEPLPFHAMSSYPYPAAERYPDSAEHQHYRATYNTRVLVRPLPPLEIIAPSRGR